MNVSMSSAPDKSLLNSAVARGSTPPRILIVEDDPITARYLELGLKRMGYAQVRIAASSEQALDAVQQAPCDLALMDIQIDGVRDGIDTARVLRDRFDVPVIFLTGLADEATMERARELDPLGYLVKPVKAEDLRTALAAGLQKEQLARAIRERECWFEGVLAAQGEAVFACHSAGRIEFANAAARQLLGLPAGELPVCAFGELAGLRTGSGEIVTDPNVLQDGELTADLLCQSVERPVRIALRRIRDLHDRPLGVVLVVRLADDRTALDAELRRLRAELAAQSLSDDLTGLHNRRGFNVMGEQHLKLVRRGRSAVNILVVALRDVKRINDEYGREAGDQALRDAATVLRDTVRESDLTGRLGGGEFAVLANAPDASELIARLNANVAAHNASSGRAWTLAIDVGVVVHQPKDLRRMQELLDAAARTVRRDEPI